MDSWPPFSLGFRVFASWAWIFELVSAYWASRCNPISKKLVLRPHLISPFYPISWSIFSLMRELQLACRCPVLEFFNKSYTTLVTLFWLDVWSASIGHGVKLHTLTLPCATRCALPCPHLGSQRGRRTFRPVLQVILELTVASNGPPPALARGSRGWPHRCAPQRHRTMVDVKPDYMLLLLLWMCLTSWTQTT